MTETAKMAEAFLIMRSFDEARSLYIIDVRNEGIRVGPYLESSVTRADVDRLESLGWSTHTYHAAEAGDVLVRYFWH